jgi:hypothetical protein
LIEPEDDGCGDTDGGHEGVGTSVVAGVDAPPVFEPAEHDFDLVALAVERGIVRDRHFPVLFEGMQAVILRSARAARNQSAS